MKPAHTARRMRSTVHIEDGSTPRPPGINGRPWDIRNKFLRITVSYSRCPVRGRPYCVLILGESRVFLISGRSPLASNK